MMEGTPIFCSSSRSSRYEGEYILIIAQASEYRREVGNCITNWMLLIGSRLARATMRRSALRLP